MVSVVVNGPSYIFGDNKYVLCDTTIPGFTCKSKAQSITYHIVNEGAARDEWRSLYVNTHEITKDLLAKVLPVSEK